MRTCADTLCSPCDLHYIDEHALYATRSGGYLDPRVPILLQLRSTQPDLHDLYAVQIRVQEVDTPHHR